MRKLKTEFKKSEFKTELMKEIMVSGMNLKHEKGYSFLGVYDYKNYEIIFDKVPDGQTIRKHITIKEIHGQDVKEKELVKIAEHFIGKGYAIQYGLFDKHMVSIFEESLQ